MGRRSKVRQLAPELRKELDRLLADDRLTHAQIAEHMRTLGASVSESAVYRYSAKYQELAKSIRLAREAASTIGRELTDVADGPDAGRLVVESLQALLFRAQFDMLEANETGNVDDVKLARLAGCARDLAAALKASVDTELRVRDRVAKEAAKVVTDECRAQGLSAASVEQFKARILGLRLTPAAGATS